MSDLKLKRLMIGKNSYIHYDTIATDEFSGQLVFASLVDTDKELKNAQYEVNKKNSIYLEALKRYVVSDGRYDVEKRKAANSDFGHLVVNKKDYIEELAEDNELLTAYIYTKNIDELNSKIYDKLYDNTSIPLLEEWIPYLKDEMMKNQYLREINVDSIMTINHLELLN
jgi:hypothetical protein